MSKCKRRDFLKGGLLATLGALGIIAGCGSGRVSGLIESGSSSADDADTELESSSSAQYIVVWSADLLTDTATNDRARDESGEVIVISNAKPDRIFARMHALCHRFIFYDNGNIGGSAGLKTLNTEFAALCVEAGITPYKPKLKPFYMRKEVGEALFGKSCFFDMNLAKSRLSRSIFQYWQSRIGVDGDEQGDSYRLGGSDPDSESS